MTTGSGRADLDGTGGALVEEAHMNTTLSSPDRPDGGRRVTLSR